MLVKLALVNAKLENIPEKYGGRTIFNFFGMGHSCYEGNWGCVGGVEWGDWKTPQTMLIQSTCIWLNYYSTSLPVLSGDQCLHVEYNRLFFLFSSIFLLKDSHLAKFFVDIRIFLEMQIEKMILYSLWPQKNRIKL